MSGGLGGEAHEQVAPLASQRYYLPISFNTQRSCRSASIIMESCVKSSSRSERKEDFGKGVTSTFRHGLT